MIQEIERPQADVLPFFVKTVSAIAAAVTGGVVLVLDHSNAFRAGWFRIDFSLLSFHFGGDILVDAHAVVSLPDAAMSNRAGQHAFYGFLRHSGWRVHDHRLVAAKGSARPLWTENERAVDGQVRALVRQSALSERCDTIVLISGDGGMTPAVHDARTRGKRVVVLSWQSGLHPALRAAADDVFLIDELQPLLERRML